MLIVDVDVISSRADRERFLLKLIAVPIHQLISQLHVLRQSASTDVANLTKLNNVAFL